MRSLASFAMRGPWQAALVVATTAILSLLLPPMLFLSGAALALVALRQGLRPAMLVLLITIIGGGLLALFAVGQPTIIILLLALVWLPLLILALTLRSTRSLATTLHIAMVIGAVALVLFYLVIGDPQVWLAPIAEEISQQLREANLIRPEDAAKLPEALAQWAPFLPGQAIASFLFTILASLMLGRWWQALLYNPGGLRAEFHELRLGQSAAIIMIAVLGAALVFGEQFPFLINLAFILGLVYLFQGAALAHGLVAKLGLSSIWLVSFYLLTVIVISQLVLILALIDTWVDFRARVKTPPKHS